MRHVTLPKIDNFNGFNVGKSVLTTREIATDQMRGAFST